MSILICVARMYSNGNYILGTLVALSIYLNLGAAASSGLAREAIQLATTGRKSFDSELSHRVGAGLRTERQGTRDRRHAGDPVSGMFRQQGDLRCSSRNRLRGS